MQTIRLGRTGLEVGVAGLGCGGHSRLGTGTGHDESHAVRIVRRAMDLGIDFIDTARVYGTEPAVGKAIRGRRDQVVISTKVGPGFGGGDSLLTPQGLTENLEKSLRALGTDYVDVYHLHGMRPEQYPHCLEYLVPEMHRQRDAGKIRFLGVTETFIRDPQHRMFEQVLPDDHFDVIMVGFSMLNPSARERVFAQTLERDVGTLIMFAVRRALSRPEALSVNCWPGWSKKVSWMPPWPMRIPSVSWRTIRKSSRWCRRPTVSAGMSRGRMSSSRARATSRTSRPTSRTSRPRSCPTRSRIDWGRYSTASIRYRATDRPAAGIAP